MDIGCPRRIKDPSTLTRTSDPGGYVRTLNPTTHDLTSDPPTPSRTSALSKPRTQTSPKGPRTHNRNTPYILDRIPNTGVSDRTTTSSRPDTQKPQPDLGPRYPW